MNYCTPAEVEAEFYARQVTRDSRPSTKPGVLQSWVNPDLLHSYCYTPEVAAPRSTLGARAGATGSIWHLPVDVARRTRRIVVHNYRLAGQRPHLADSQGPQPIPLNGG